MDITTVSLGTDVRDQLAEYRDREDHENYNDAVSSLLSEVEQ